MPAIQLVLAGVAVYGLRTLRRGRAPSIMSDYGYGLWWLVAINSLVIIIIAASFFHPKSSRDWRALGGFSAFIVAPSTPTGCAGSCRTCCLL
jgi:hypothetical protein